LSVIESVAQGARQSLENTARAADSLSKKDVTETSYGLENHVLGEQLSDEINEVYGKEGVNSPTTMLAKAASQAATSTHVSETTSGTRHLPLTPRDVYSQQELKALNQMFQRGVEAIAKQMRDKNAAKRAAAPAAAQRPYRDRTSLPSFDCPTCSGTDSAPSTSTCPYAVCTVH
jgi:hypothetical protein